MQDAITSDAHVNYAGYHQGSFNLKYHINCWTLKNQHDFRGNKTLMLHTHAFQSKAIQL